MYNFTIKKALAAARWDLIVLGQTIATAATRTELTRVVVSLTAQGYLKRAAK